MSSHNMLEKPADTLAAIEEAAARSIEHFRLGVKDVVETARRALPVAETLSPAMAHLIGSPAFGSIVGLYTGELKLDMYREGESVRVAAEVDGQRGVAGELRAARSGRYRLMLIVQRLADDDGGAR